MSESCLHNNSSKTMTKIRYKEAAKEEVGKLDLAVRGMKDLGKRVRGCRSPTSHYIN